MLFGLSLVHAAFAHDPLQEEDHHSYQAADEGHHGRQRSADLSRVRSLVLAFRRTGDDRHLDTAWTEVSHRLSDATIDPKTLVAAAFVAQSRHQFQFAVSLLDRATADNNRNDEAWLLKASILLVQGDAVRALEACRQLREVPVLVLITCQARVSLLSGNTDLALARLERVLAISDVQEIPAEIRAWSLSVAGDLAAALGDAQQARHLYRRSLQLAERTQVRAALADVLLERSEYEQAFAIIPSTTTALALAVRRLIAAKHLDRFDEVSEASARINREFERWIAAEDWLHAREMARFYLDVVVDPARARRLADVNIGLQREPEDLRLVERTRAPRG